MACPDGRLEEWCFSGLVITPVHNGGGIIEEAKRSFNNNWPALWCYGDY